MRVHENTEALQLVEERTENLISGLDFNRGNEEGNWIEASTFLPPRTPEFTEKCQRNRAGTDEIYGLIVESVKFLG